MGCRGGVRYSPCAMRPLSAFACAHANVDDGRTAHGEHCAAPDND
jgi:hypothetical protein